MADTRASEVLVGNTGRVAAGIAAAVVAALSMAYTVVPRTVEAVVSGCTPSEAVECVATVTAEPQSALVIAGLVVAVYLALIALSGRVPTLKIGDSSVSLTGTTAGQATPAEAATGEPLQVQAAEGGEENVQSLPASLGSLYYGALPEDVRRAADALWGMWGETNLAQHIVGVTRGRGPGPRPYFITASSRGEERVLRITPVDSGPSGDVVVVR